MLVFLTIIYQLICELKSKSKTTIGSDMKDIKKISSVIVCVVFMGCATITPEQKNTLGVEAARCLLTAVEKNDDGISPADTVALGLISSCQVQIDAYDNARVPEKFTYFGATFWANRMNGWIKQVTAIVLQSRVEKRR